MNATQWLIIICTICTCWGCSVGYLWGRADGRDKCRAYRTVLKDCADALESEINNFYRGTLDYPSQRRYNRDMAPVVSARKLLDR